MSLILDGSNGLTFPNSTTQASAGQVLQVVQSLQSPSQTSTTSTSFVSTGFTGTITPKFATSKILVIINGCCYIGGQGVNAGIGIYRGSVLFSQTATYVATGGASQASFSLNYVDSPATTSPVTYALYYKTQNASAACYINGDTVSPINFIMMEIAA